MCVGNHLYEYAVIRFVPRIEREEFINVGLLMMCKRMKWIRAQLHVPENKMAAFVSEITPENLHNQLEQFRCITSGDCKAGPIATLSVEERFRWLSAVRSSCVQTSRPHPGLTDDLDMTFDKLFSELVM